MKTERRLPLLLLVSLLFGLSLSAVTPLREPGISPDGTTVAFVAGGDIWTVPAEGGEARLLVAHAADESRPLYSPDGSRLAFMSDRTGSDDIYILELANGNVRRLTHDDADEQLDGWSADGEWIYFSSFAHEIAGMNDLFRVRTSGGTPMPVISDAYTNEYSAAASPDGRRVAFVGHGLGSAQWWRNGHSHIDTSEIWIRDLESGQTDKVTPEGAKNLWPMWSDDGSTIFFVSDRSGTENLWAARLGGDARPRTMFDSGRLLWPSIAANGSIIAFERDFGIWTLDTRSDETRRINVTLAGARSAPEMTVRTFTDSIDEMALSPDGKKIAFIVHGEVFAVSASEGGAAYRVTCTPAAEFHVSWAPDSRRLVYASERGGGTTLHLFDFVSEEEKELTSGPAGDTHPAFSPDGSRIAFLRDGRDIRVVDTAGGDSRSVATATVDLVRPLSSIRPFVWSPDGDRIAFMSFGERLFRNVSIVSADGSSPPVPVSFVGNVFNETVSWSPDGRSIFFDTGQRTEPGQVARLDLVPRTPRFREAEFRELFEEETPKSVPPADTPAAEPKKPEADKPEKPEIVSEVVLEGIRRRLQILPIQLDVQQQVLSPDGKTLLLVATSGGKEDLYLFPLDELARDAGVAKQLTSTGSQKAAPVFTPDGKEIVFLQDGTIAKVSAEGGEVKPIAVSAEMEIDFERERDESFSQAWRWMRDHFHDPSMNGVDWKAVGDRFASLVRDATTPAELHRLLNLMVGELDASHLGSRSGARSERSTGRLGLRFDRREYEDTGRFRISRVIPLSPAAVTRDIREGEYLIALDGQRLRSSSSLAELLDRKIDREVWLTISSDADGRTTRRVAVRPMNLGTEKELVYADWVERNRRYVTDRSGGRLGYVHMPDMGWSSYIGLIRDLDAENQTRDGVVIDIRNNNGGFVNAYALDVFSRQHYLGMRFRGIDAISPARTILGQRSVERPTVLLTNRHSLSDAEDFTEGYRSLGLGKVVGEPTAGWIIYTSNVPLVDGSIFRLPFITVFTTGGENMEMNPRPVDILVRKPIGAEDDPQLDRAISTLLGDIEGQ